MGGSTRLVGGPKGWRRWAGLLAWLAVLAFVLGLNAMWLTSVDRSSLETAVVPVVGLIGVLALGVLLQYVWGRYSARRLRGVSDIHAVTSLTVLAEVPAMHWETADLVAVAANQPAYAHLAAELAETAQESGRDRLLITSPTSGDGRTTTAVSLATLSAAEGLSVVLVSADPNGEGVDEVLGLDRRPGLTEVF